VEGEPITVSLAFVAGLLSFASPCVLPLVPAYVGYLGGQLGGEGGEASRWRILAHGVFFVAGFSAVFVALGAAATAIGRLAHGLQPILTALGGLLVLLVGLNQLGVLRIPLLSSDARYHLRAGRELGYLSSVLVGVFFGAGYSPCVGAPLAAILTLALSEASAWQGAGLLLAYSLGIGTPLLAMALAIDRVAPVLARASRAMRVVGFVSGLLLVVVGGIILINSVGSLVY